MSSKEKLLVRFYDWVEQHRRLSVLLLVLILGCFTSMVTRLKYQEDITAFLPVDDNYRSSVQIYQEVASADKVVLQFCTSDTTAQVALLGEAANRFGEILTVQDRAHWIDTYESQVDQTQILDIVSFVYEHLPYLLTSQDYARLDSLWTPEYEQQRLSYIQMQLSGLSSSYMLPMLQTDPLNLSESLLQKLKAFQPQINYQLADGYLLSPDGRSILITIQTPFGSSETNLNGQLIDLLEQTALQLQQEPEFASVEVHLMGSPVIAVGNARQIKRDTLLAVALSIVLILALLFYSFRNFKALLHIVLGTGFGFLFALTGITLFRDSISLIVVGISSVIIGIAVNYPLHMACEGNGRKALKELVAPLLIGNVTTVAAFLTLLPLQAVALRDLGLFSAMMLVGTILWVLFVQPHFPINKHPNEVADSQAVEEEGKVSLIQRWISSPWLVCLLFLLTVWLGYHSLDTQFDSNLSNLNYMTPQQHADMQMLESMQGQNAGTVVYVTGSADALQQELLLSSVHQDVYGGIIVKNPTWFIPTETELQHRLELWQNFWLEHHTQWQHFCQISHETGFSATAFQPLQNLIAEPEVGFDTSLLANTLLTGYVGKDALVARVIVENASSVLEFEDFLNNRTHLLRAFDIQSLNSQVADALTHDFNYIGFACGFIVFFFLWISFRRFELALLAFLPMAVGWIWILGFMHLFHIQFNVVNIILATFIFGQGDDYTIFITEALIRDFRKHGCIGQHTTLIRYQRSILLSALIMLVGIGILIIAKHPAMHSLAEVTIIGMTVVLLMSWILPPMAFHWLIKYDKPLQKFLYERKDL